MPTKVVDTATPRSSSPSPVCTESILNRLLYDPPRWGWSAVGGITDLLTPHERSRRRSTQAGYRQKIRLEKEKEKKMANKNESINFDVSNKLTETNNTVQPEPTPLVNGEAVSGKPKPPQQETPSQIQALQRPQLQPNLQAQQPPLEPQQPKVQAELQIEQPLQQPQKMETELQAQQLPAEPQQSQMETELQVQPTQSEPRLSQVVTELQVESPQLVPQKPQMETKLLVHKTTFEPRQEAIQPQIQEDSQMPPSQPSIKAQQQQVKSQPIAKNESSLTSSTGLAVPQSSIRPVTPTVTGTNPVASSTDSPTAQAESTARTRIEDNSVLWGMSLKPSSEEDGNPSENQIREVEASVEAYKDDVLDMYSYHRGREGMEPRDPDSGELLAAHIPTDTNHNFDSQKLLVTITVEFPLEDDDGVNSSNSEEHSEIATFREILQWDLDDPSTPSPAEFANGIAEEYGLSFGQMMDLASSIQRQIDAHLRQNCNYCVPIAINAPNGNHRGFNPEIRQAQPYDYVVRGSGGGILISKKRPPKHLQQCPLKPKATDSLTPSSRTSRKGAERGYNRESIEVDEEVEDVYCEEIQKRAMDASKQCILAKPVGGKGGFLEQKKNFHCHICHKKCDVAYAFACGIVNHVYCLAHCKNRLDLDIDIEKPDSLVYCPICPICSLSCQCSACSRKLQNVAYDFKKECTEQNTEPCQTIFPNVLEKCQNASAIVSSRRTIRVIEVATNTSEKTGNKKSGKGSPKSSDVSSKKSRADVPKPSLLDFPREVFGAVDMDVGHPDDYMTVYSCEGLFRAYSIPEVWEKEQKRALEIQREEKASGSLSQEIVVSSCEEVIEDGNVDYCNVCKKAGNIICCDFCPRAFHPPCIRDDAISNGVDGEEKWECPVCKKEKQGLPEDLIDGASYHEALSASISGNDDLMKDKNGLKVFSIINEMVNKLMAYDFGVIFQKPVQGEKGYKKIVKHPMDLGTIRTKIENGRYIDVKAESFEAAIIAALKDVELVWHNCFLYNALDSAVYRMAGVLNRRALGIQMASFDHLLSDAVKSSVGEYVSLCKKERLQLLLAQRPKNLADAKALQAKQPKGKYKIFVNSKNGATKKVAILDPATGRVVKTYSSVKNAIVAHAHLERLGHKCGWTEPDIHKLINRSITDPKCLIFGYRWLPLDDLRTKKVKFRKKASVSAATVFEMKHGDCRYRFLSIEDALSYLFLPPAIEMTDAKAQLKRIPAGADFVELFGSGWRKPVFDVLNSEKGNEMMSSEKQKILLAGCAVVKKDSFTRRTLMGFGSENAAFEDWKRAKFASPLPTEAKVEGDLEHFRKEYLEGSRNVDGIVWNSFPASKRDEARSNPAQTEPSGLQALPPTSVGERSTSGMNVDEAKKNEQKVENPHQSKEEQIKVADPTTSAGKYPSLLGKRKLVAGEDKQAQQKKQACNVEGTVDV